ncbi:hypothetical protein SAMN04489761_0985 [Tenacibaculum sp. MAR_2009_124]|nr:hypothetical protein SAMN04489761_0985 [Tenacibaculum sp. MAR_2009_124]
MNRFYGNNISELTLIYTDSIRYLSAKFYKTCILAAFIILYKIQKNNFTNSIPMEDKIIEGLAYALPALVTGGVAYYILTAFIKQDNNERKFEALVTKKKESLPIKLQAYERMLLFCERINPIKLLVRVNPIGDDVNGYLRLLTANIEQEYEHNLVQQLYISDESWKSVLATKLAIIAKLRKVAETSETSAQLRENVLLDYTKEENPTDVAVGYLKQEVKKLL